MLLDCTFSTLVYANITFLSKWMKLIIFFHLAVYWIFIDFSFILMQLSTNELNLIVGCDTQKSEHIQI